MQEKKKHSKAVIFTPILLILAIVSGWYYLRTWPLRFHGQLDDFFGAGNWEVISEDTKESIMYSESIIVRDTLSLSGDIPGRFHEWDIAFTNRDGETEIWTISDHTMKINHDEYWLLSPDRYSAKQSLGQELMDISFAMAGEQVHKDILQTLLPASEADCITVDISFRGGRPDPELYSDLLKEPWFTANEVTADDFLQSDLNDFYIDVFAYDYRVDKLSSNERAHLLGSLTDIENALKDTYGDYVDYEIYLGDGCRAEYTGPKG